MSEQKWEVHRADKWTDWSPRDMIGRKAIWSLLHRDKRVHFIVTVVDVRKLWDRHDLLLETNAGSRVWASTDTVELLKLPAEQQLTEEEVTSVVDDVLDDDQPKRKRGDNREGE